MAKALTHTINSLHPEWHQIGRKRSAPPDLWQLGDAHHSSHHPRVSGHTSYTHPLRSKTDASSRSLHLWSRSTSSRCRAVFADWPTNTTDRGSPSRVHSPALAGRALRITLSQRQYQNSAAILPEHQTCGWFNRGRTFGLKLSRLATFHHASRATVEPPSTEPQEVRKVASLPSGLCQMPPRASPPPSTSMNGSSLLLRLRW